MFKFRPVLALAALVASVPAVLGSSAHAATERHCIARLAPGVSVQAPKLVGCFDTFAAVAAAATGGRVQLDPTADRASQVAALDSDLARLPVESVGGSPGTGDSAINTANGGEVVIGVDFSDWHYQGNSIWYVAASGCAETSWGISSMPSGWNDIVSSARGYSGCTTYLHYEDTNHGGNVAYCTCYYIGDTLNDKTSSEEWYSS